MNRKFMAAALLGAAVFLTGCGSFYAPIASLYIPIDDEMKNKADRGDPAAQLNVGQTYNLRGDDKQAEIWFRKAADQGSVEAMFRLSGIYTKRKDAVQEIFWMRKSAEQGYAPAQEMLGMDYEYGTIPPENKPDKEQAMVWYRKSAEQGYAIAQVRLGMIYEKNQDKEQALVWYRKAAAQGDAPAQQAIDRMKEAQDKAIQLAADKKDDTPEGRAQLVKAVNRGDASARNRLISAYIRLAQAAQDPAQTEAWYRKAIAIETKTAAREREHLYPYYESARSELAIFFNKSGETSLSRQNPEQARVWFHKAIEQISIDPDLTGVSSQTTRAYAGMGDSYLAEQDPAQAAVWYRKVVERDLSSDRFLSDAWYQLAVLYDTGQGVAQDRDEAYFLLWNAARHYDEKGRDYLNTHFKNFHPSYAPMEYKGTTDPHASAVLQLWVGQKVEALEKHRMWANHVTKQLGWFGLGLRKETGENTTDSRYRYQFYERGGVVSAKTITRFAGRTCGPKDCIDRYVTETTPSFYVPDKTLCTVVFYINGKSKDDKNGTITSWQMDDPKACDEFISR